MMCWSIVEATPRCRQSGATRIDLISPSSPPSSFRAPQAITRSSSIIVQNVISGARSPSRSRACLLSGGVTDRISSMCSSRNSAISGPVRSSTTISISPLFHGRRPHRAKGTSTSWRRRAPRPAVFEKTPVLGRGTFGADRSDRRMEMSTKEAKSRLERTLKVPGATLYYEVRGSGPVLLCISGGPTDAGMFSDLASRLADRYTVVCYDQRGHSRSALDSEPEDIPVALHADDAAAILAALGDEPAYVYGSR